MIFTTPLFSSGSNLIHSFTRGPERLTSCSEVNALALISPVLPLSLSRNATLLGERIQGLLSAHPRRLVKFLTNRNSAFILEVAVNHLCFLF